MLSDPHTGGPFRLREYQRGIIDHPARHKALRLGRQIGKTFCLAATALWRAICFPGSKIAVVTPRESQLKNIVSMIKNFVAKAHKSVRSQFEGSRSQPIEITFYNGSTIRFFTVARESMSSGGSTIRGQSISDLFIDEADFIDDQTMEEAILPTTSNFPFFSLWLSSTPTGRVGFFYKEWYSGNYALWHMPSSVSPSWTQEKQDRVDRLDAATREHEYLANWYTGETSVFKTDLIKRCETIHSKIMFDGRNMINYDYGDQETLMERSKYRIIGVDWNKGHGTRIVGVTVDQTGKICIAFKERIDASEFQQHLAIQKILDIDKWFNSHYIAVDVGYGDMQIEELRLITVRNPANLIGEKIIPVETGGMLEI